MTGPAPARHILNAGDGHAHVGTLRGPLVQVYGGLGDGLTTSLAALLTPPATARSLTDRGLRSLDAVFVPPNGYGDAAGSLKAGRTVVLTGPPGAGRRSCALMLLFGMLGESGRVRELSNERDPERDAQTDAVPATPSAPPGLSEGDGALLDLCATPLTSASDVAYWLGRIADAEHAGCPLVVVVPRDRWHHFGREWASVHSITAPDRVAVLKRHLRALTVSFAPRDLTPDTPLGQAVVASSMAELALLAQHIRDEGRRAPHAAFAEWADAALTATSRRDKQVSDWLREHRDGTQRALLVAAAMLDGSGSDEVWRASTVLASLSGIPADDTSPLEQPDLYGRLSDVGFTVDADRGVHHAGTQEFRPRHIRDHVWRNHPQLRPHLCRWIRRVVREQPLDRAGRATVVLRFAEQCLAVDDPTTLLDAAEDWAGAEHGRLAVPVRLALHAGLAHERHGAVFRRRLREWASHATGFGIDIDTVLVELCSTVIAQTHPDQALVRLHHFARRAEPAVARAAAEGLYRLVDRDPFLRWRALARLADELTRRGLDADVGLFLRLADAPALLDRRGRRQSLVRYPRVRSVLVDAWRVVFRRPPPRWQDTVVAWLSAPPEKPDTPLLLDILADACDGDTAALSRLEFVAAAWCRDPGARGARVRQTVLTEVVRRVDGGRNPYLSTT